MYFILNGGETHKNTRIIRQTFSDKLFLAKGTGKKEIKVMYTFMKITYNKRF